MPSDSSIDASLIQLLLSTVAGDAGEHVEPRIG